MEFSLIIGNKQRYRGIDMTGFFPPYFTARFLDRQPLLPCMNRHLRANQNIRPGYVTDTQTSYEPLTGQG